jgi:hypothetical protein
MPNCMTQTPVPALLLPLLPPSQHQLPLLPPLLLQQQSRVGVLLHQASIPLLFPKAADAASQSGLSALASQMEAAAPDAVDAASLTALRNASCCGQTLLLLLLVHR